MHNTLSLLCTAALLGTAGADAAVAVDITGGNGAPITVTILQPIEYTVNNGTSFWPVFVLDGAGDFLSIATNSVTGTLSFSVNGGPEQFINRANSEFTSGVVGPDDFYFYLMNSSTQLQTGDTVVLNAGTFTTTGSFAVATPGQISIETFLMGAFGEQVSGNGVAVPEPGSALLLGLGCAGMFLRRRRAA